MEFHFLWIIGSAVFLAWLSVHLFVIEPKKINMARSWYSVPVIGLGMLLTWVFIQLAQIAT